MLQHAGLNEEIANTKTCLGPSEAILAGDNVTEQSVILPVDAILTADNLIERVEQLQLMYAMYQRKVILKDPHSSSKSAINDGSEYEGSDEQSPLHRKDTRSVAKRPQSAKLLSASRPDSAKAKPLQASLKRTSKLLLEALLSGQGCPGPAIQAEALEVAYQGQLNCLFRLSVFIWPVWLDDRCILAANKPNAHAGVVLQMSHQEVIQQLNSLCQAQESNQHKGSGQNDTTIQHMASVCVQRCSELLRSRDFQTTKQILQKTTQLTRRIATTARTQLKLLPLKLIAAMLHVGDGNIRDAVFELRSAIESIPIEHDSVKPYITTDVALLYNHLSYYYSLLGSRVEACRYTRMGIEVMAEYRSTMARSDMASQSLSVDEISARHQYIDAVLMINQVVAEISNEHSAIDAAKALCSDAVMFLEEVGTSTACVSHLTDRLQPLFENIQRVLSGKKPGDGPLPNTTLSGGDDVEQMKFDHGQPSSSKGNVRVSTTNDGIQKTNGRATGTKNPSAKAKQSKVDLSASFGVVRSHQQVASLKPSKTKILSWVQTPVAPSWPPSGARSGPVSPNTRSMQGNSKFKMLMLGPALAKGMENHPIPSFTAHSCDHDEKKKLPESLIQALFPPSFNSSKKRPFETAVSFDGCSPDIFNVDVHTDSSLQASNFSAKHAPNLDFFQGSKNDDAVSGEDCPPRIQFYPTKTNIRIQGSVNHIKNFDIESLQLCCNIIKSLTCSFDSCEKSSHQQIKLAAHCASKLACETCYLFKLEGKSPDSTSAKTLLLSGKYISAFLDQGGILTTQMNRFLQNGVLMRPVAILDEDNFTEANDELDRAILPINAEKCSILMGVIPGNSQLNNISGFLIAIRSPSAASFDPEELLVCELLCNCCSQSLPLL